MFILFWDHKDVMRIFKQMLEQKVGIISLQCLQMFILFWDHKDVVRIFKQMLEQKN